METEHLSGYHHYAVRVISIENLASTFRNRWIYASKDLNLSQEQYEDAYDWCVKQALQERLRSYSPHCKIVDHCRHDVYLCLYSYMSVNFNLILNNELREIAQSGTALFYKVMVCGTLLFLAIGTIPNY